MKNLFSKQHIFVIILYATFSMSSTSIWCMEEASLKKEQAKNIFFAIKEKDLEVVKNIIDSSPEKINNKATKEDCKICKNEICIGITPIALACLKGKADIIIYLVEKGANFNAPFTLGSLDVYTPLLIACINGKIDVIECLVEKMEKLQIDFNAPLKSGDNTGWTPLAFACHNDHSEVVRYLVEKMEKLNIDFNAPLTSGNNTGWTPLSIACTAGSIKTAKYLIEKDEKYINKPILTKDTFNGWTPLAIACNEGKVEVVKYLVEKMEKLQIDFNAPLKSGSSAGFTPLAFACDKNKVVVAKYLVEKMEKLKIDFNAPLTSGSNAGWTPLAGACYKGNFEIVEYLVGKKQEDINKPIRTKCDLNGYTPLAIACVEGNFNIVKYLVEKLKILNKDFINAPLTFGPNTGWTPISIACNLGFVDVSKYLVEELYELGLDFNATLTFGPNKGLTPLLIAVNNKNFKIAEIIKEVYKKKIPNKEVCSKNIESEENILEDKTLTCKKITGNPEVFKQLILNNCKDNKKDLIDKLFNLLENNIHRIGLLVNGVKDDEGNTPLAWACRNSNWPLVQELLKYSNDDTINTFNNEKKSCLYYACEKIASNEIIEKLATIETVSPSNDNPELHPIFIALKLYNANKDNPNGEILANIIHSLVARNANLECLFKECMIDNPLKDCSKQIKNLILLAREFDNVKKEGFLKFLISMEEKRIKGFEKILSTLISRIAYRSFYEIKKGNKAIHETDFRNLYIEIENHPKLGPKTEKLKDFLNKDFYSIMKELNEKKKLQLDFSVIKDDCCICLCECKASKKNFFMSKCWHIFHETCIKQWLEKKKGCPTCRAKI